MVSTIDCVHTILRDARHPFKMGLLDAYEDPPKRGAVHSFVPGSFRPAEHELEEIDGEQFEMPVDSITLFDGESTHRLSRLIKATRKFVQELESDLLTRFDFSEPSGRDLQITAQFSFNDTGETAQKITIALK